jgi:hypothetical protein
MEVEEPAGSQTVKPTLMEVTLTEATQMRVNGILAQRQALDAQVSETLAVAFEAIGLQGKLMGYNVKTGVVTYEPTVTALPNRTAQRRSSKAERPAREAAEAAQ